MRTLNYKTKQYHRAEYLIKNTSLFNGDNGSGIFKGKPYPFILKNNVNNLFQPIVPYVFDYFRNNSIAWWNGKLTNHTLSSQVACLNHLFLILNDQNAVLSLIQNVCPSIVEVLEIPTDKFEPGYIQFESVSDHDHLNELTSTRGSNCTSVDALIVGKHYDGRTILFPIEWKYVEAYGNDDKSRNEKGQTRLSRYTQLINDSKQLRIDDHRVYYFEPFYQLMRQTLWAEQMIQHRHQETISADDFIHIHVIPNENTELLDKKYPCSGMGMEETWRSQIIDQSKYKILSPQQFLTPLSQHNYPELVSYLTKRYW
jgi:hypothetical protein